MDVKEQSIEKLKSAIKGEERKCYKMQKLNPLRIKKVPTQPLKDKQVGVMIKKLSDKMYPVTLPAQTGEAAAECKPESSPGCDKPAALSIAIPEWLNEITVHKLRSRSIKRVVERLIENESDLQKPLGVSITRDSTQSRDSTAKQNLEQSPDRHLQSGTGSNNAVGQKHGPDSGTKMGTGTSKQSSTQVNVQQPAASGNLFSHVARSRGDVSKRKNAVHLLFTGPEPDIPDRIFIGRKLLMEFICIYSLSWIKTI
ncbi:Hypothetical predicted protein [Pelobates cultripes]|uniref:Uncharacterized protein n=1 Tax=Pelobates cultripes TaxID=61616 RepID=A0AAD1VWD7_PELCU|nr:Hypothetical predicted protein [Pelobates cultripes]